MEILSSPSSSSSPFPWDRLPRHLQESILCRLPISALLRCSAAARSLRSLVRSPTFLTLYRESTPRQPIFFFNFCYHMSRSDDDPSRFYEAYDPLFDRWISLPPQPSHVFALDECPPLAYLPSSDDLTVYDPFSITSHRTSTSIPPPLPLYNFSPLALISSESNSDQFKILAAAYKDERLSSQVYNSTTCVWTPAGTLDCGEELCIRHGSAVFANSLLYFQTEEDFKDYLPTFNPDNDQWDLVVVSSPSAQFWEIFQFEGKLMLAGGIEETGVIVGVGFWELDWVNKEWKSSFLMPHDIFTRFSEGGLFFVSVAEMRGMLCLVGHQRQTPEAILMCDLLENKWWWPSERQGIKERVITHAVYALEPYVGLLSATK